MLELTLDVTRRRLTLGMLPPPSPETLDVRPQALSEGELTRHK